MNCYILSSMHLHSFVLFVQKKNELKKKLKIKNTLKSETLENKTFDFEAMCDLPLSLNKNDTTL